MPGHAGALPMVKGLPAERIPSDGTILIAGAESGLNSQRARVGLVPPERNEAPVSEAGFLQTEPFYVGMNWRGWVAHA